MCSWVNFIGAFECVFTDKLSNFGLSFNYAVLYYMYLNRKCTQNESYEFVWKLPLVNCGTTLAVYLIFTLFAPFKTNSYLPRILPVSCFRLSGPLLSRFDLVFILLDKPNEEMDALLSMHVMALHGSKQSQRNMSQVYYNMLVYMTVDYITIFAIH